MGIKKRKQIKSRQRARKREKRRKMKQKGLNPDDFYYEGLYLGSPR